MKLNIYSNKFKIFMLIITFCSIKNNNCIESIKKETFESKKKLAEANSELFGASDFITAQKAIDNGANPNYIAYQKLTPIFMASANNHPDVVQLLIDKGANINFKNSDGMTPLMAAASAGHLDTVKILVNNGANIYLTYDDNNKIGIKGYTAIDFAKDGGHKEVVEFLNQYIRLRKQQIQDISSLPNVLVDIIEEYEYGPKNKIS